MAKQMVRPNEGREISNRAIMLPEGNLSVADGRELAITRWAPVLDAGECIRVSIEAIVLIEKHPSVASKAANGTT
jgi:hypothetical protein